MTKIKRLIAILMATVMMIGSVSVAASAAHTPYLDSAILNQYNTIDKAEINTLQKSSLILDMLDIMLDKEQILIDIPLIGEINLCSTDEALNSIYSLTGNILYGRLTVGDLVVLETHRDKIASVRRTTTDKTDLDVINSLVDYVAAVIPTLTGMLDGTMSWGIVKGFLPPEFRIIIDDFDKFLKEMLWDALHPVNEETYPSTTTLDSLVQFMYDNQLGGQRPDVMGFEGVMPGFSVNLATDDAYRTIEEGIYCALNEFIIPVLNGDLKATIQDAVESNTNNGGDLAELVDVNYVIESYNFDETKGLVEQLNDVFKDVVDEMLLPNQFNWVATGTNDPVETLKTNLRGLLITIIEAGGETENVSEYTLKQLGDYIARVAVEQFVKHMDLDVGDSMAKIAYEGLVELCASTIPEITYTAPANGATDDVYRDAIVEIAADLGAFYLNNNIGLNSDISRTADQFLSDFATWCMQYVDGLFDKTQYNLATTGWDKIDAILWEIIPKEWLPYAEMFKDADGTAGTASELTFKSLVEYILDAIFAFDLDAIATIFEHNANCELSGTARQVVINFIRNILDGAFYTVDSNGAQVPCIPATATIDEFEDILSDISILKSTVSNIFAAISTRKDVLVPTTINLVTMLMGAVDPQSLGDVELAINSQVYCENGTVPSQTLRISNYTDGLNRAWRDAEGTLAQDKMYEIEVVSVTNDGGLTLSAIPENTKIAANAYYDVTVSGTISETQEVRFDVSYYILDEYGNRLNTTALVKSIYANFSTTAYGCGGTSAAIDSTNRVSFEEFDTHLHTTDAYDISLFSILATNNGVILGNAVRDVRRAVLKSGTLPTGITMNNPTDGPIVRIEEASFTTDSYGTVNPYSAETMDPDDPQPYGIYDVTIAFEICAQDADSGTETEARAHQLVVYNDFGLPGLLDDIMSSNRQQVNYANATDEWNAYQAAVKAGYALLHGNVDHSKMFADVTNPDGSANAYAAAVTAIETAVANLDAKVKATNETLLAQLEAAVAVQAGVEREDYVLFTYDRWDEWYDHANGLINSQVAPEGATDFVAPAISDFDLIYAKHMVTLMYGRLIKKTPVKTHLAAAITACGGKTEANYAPDTWADYAAALANANTVNADTSADLLQTEVNSARVELMKMTRRLVEDYFVEAENSTMVVDSRNMLIYGIAPEIANISAYASAPVGITFTYDYYDDTTGYLGTGSFVNVELISSTGNEQLARYKVVLYGDVNGDGYVDEYDALDLQDYISSEYNAHLFTDGSVFFTAADVNQDGLINSSDVSIINAGNINQVDPNPQN